jgi:alkylmercury lyase
MSDLRACPPAPGGDDAGADDFDAAWREFFRRQRDKLDVVRAAMRLTGAGARPVAMDQLAAAVDRPANQVRLLVDRIELGLPSLSIRRVGDDVWLDLATTGTPRFWLQIGERRIGVGGCAPDIFGVASALAEPMRAEATCPVTGIAIVVEFTPDGVRTVQPTDAVVAAINPATVPEAAELVDSAKVDADVCTQQVFFANAAAAEPWLTRHPGGRVLPVTAFDQWLRSMRAEAGAR